MVAMKVQLIVVQGKAEGKTISLTGPVFRIGRGETCHLRPNSERVSREHAEILLSAGTVTIRDLGSRNGTLVNGKALTQTQTLRDRDLVQVGPLTFAVSLREGMVEDEAAPDAPAAEPRTSTTTEAAGARSDKDRGPADAAAAPSAGARGSETILIPAFFDSSSRAHGSFALSDDADDSEYERHPIVEGETVQDIPAADFTPPELAGKKAKPDPTGKKTGSTAAEILQNMMERRPISK